MYNATVHSDLEESNLSTSVSTVYNMLLTPTYLCVNICLCFLLHERAPCHVTAHTETILRIHFVLSLQPQCLAFFVGFLLGKKKNIKIKESLSILRLLRVCALYKSKGDERIRESVSFPPHP